MLPKINRLKRKKDFEMVFQKGEKIATDCFFLKKVKNNFPYSRFGFIISSKVSKKAVLRNKLKRRLRNLVFKKIKKIKKGFDIVLVALPNSKNKDFKELEKSLDKLFKLAKIINV